MMKISNKTKLVILAGFPGLVILLNALCYILFGITILPKADEFENIGRGFTFLVSSFITMLIMIGDDYD